MAWNDRLRPAAYTSPSGTRLEFSFENVRTEVDKKTASFEFPDADGTYVQDLGHTGRRYPLRLFFWGDNYDQEAEAFLDLLLERGEGKLEHPAYGTIDVVPFGTVSRRDDLKTAANQAVIEVTFWETIGVVYPAPQEDQASAVRASVEEYNAAAAEEFEDVTDLQGAVEQATLKGGYQAALDQASAGLSDIADAQDDVRERFKAIEDSINNGIDVLVSQPLTLAAQTIQLIQTPALAAISIQARLDAYGSLASSILSSGTTAADAGSNSFHNADLYAATYVTGGIVSVVNAQFVTKGDAVAAAENLLDLFADLTVWRDNNFQTLGEVDSGASYQQLQEAVAITAGFLVDLSFSLLQERTITLSRPRSVVDLVAELYGSVDDKIDFFITSNDLSGSEILELPRGREIVFYV